MFNFKLLLIGALMISINGFTIDVSGADCPCDQFTVQLDCNSASACEWLDSSCQNIDCTTRTSITTCNLGTTICAYTPDNKCEAFTSCANYKYADGSACLTIGCQPGDLGTDNLYPCKDITSIKKCSEQLLETDCTNHRCFWNSTTCVAPTCAQQQSLTDCIAIRSDVATTWQICSWAPATQTCSDATGLTQTNCAVLTRGSYYWNTDNSACETCAGITSSFEKLLSVVLIILLLIY